MRWRRVWGVEDSKVNEPRPTTYARDVETLSDYEARRAREGRAARRGSKTPPPSIACDRCGNELEDEQRLAYYGSIEMLGTVAFIHTIKGWLNWPVKVWCSNPRCRWKGTRTR